MLLTLLILAAAAASNQVSFRLRLDYPTEEKQPVDEHQRSFNGIRVSSSAYDVHRGADFQKKLMFYEKNSSSTTNPEMSSNPFAPSSSNSSRRSSFHQSSVNPSTNKTLNGLNNYRPSNTQMISSRTNLAERMQRSKSYKDLFDPPSSTASITHPVYYQQTAAAAIGTNDVNAKRAFYSSNYHAINLVGSTIVGSMLNNASMVADYPRQPINPNLLQDDISSSSTGHLPKPPPGNPSQNAR